MENIEQRQEEKVILGISSCLLGEKVRYNGGHTLDRFLANILGAYVDYVPVCPEVEIGLSTPREAMRLVGDAENPRLVTQKTGIDYTDRMKTWASSRLDGLANAGLSGYIFKSKSPSSGMSRVKVYNEKGGNKRNGSGIFARAFMDRFPNLPVEDEGRLNDIGIREHFIERVFTFHRWQQTLKAGKTVGGLVTFMSQNKLLFMAHNQEITRKMGSLTARAKQMDLDELFSTYESMMMQCLSYKATPRKHANVLYHMAGYFKKELEPADKEELVQTIELFRKEYVPLVVPLTLIKHYVRKFDKTYLKDQYYLNPHPVELKLRNHA